MSTGSVKDLEIILPSVAERLKPLRKSRGLTQMEMGRLLNCTDRHYQKIEYGQVNLPATALIFLADFFHVTTDDLLSRD
ncbi:MAG: helix-turn-helix transcriptional regulator [Oscillospiraceae bacterium]|jgi:transcriptional regulator with XRE-family HTH domain|nr:helix-turn-helix transcriptional regulator [Oscillospiraceae bacterium]